MFRQKVVPTGLVLLEKCLEGGEHEDGLEGSLGLGEVVVEGEVGSVF